MGSNLMHKTALEGEVGAPGPTRARSRVILRAHNSISQQRGPLRRRFKDTEVCIWFIHPCLFLCSHQTLNSCFFSTVAQPF